MKGLHFNHDETLDDQGATIDIQGSCGELACVPGDLNGDGIVNAADMAILLGAWGPNPGHPADLNQDGTVNAADLSELLANWGPCS